MKSRQYKPEDIVELLIGNDEEPKLKPRNSSIYAMSNGPVKGQGIDSHTNIDKGKEIDKGKGKEKAKERDVTEVICPGGDILLGIEGSNVAFQVYSQNLMCASASFEEFVEEIMVASGDHERILVLDPEKVDVVRLLCRILHLQNHMVPQALTPWMLLDMAIMVNKYGLQRAVVLASRQWLLSGRDSPQFLADPTLAMGCYMAAAALFFDDFMFEKCIWELVSICTVPFERLWAWPALKEQMSPKAISGCPFCFFSFIPRYHVESILIQIPTRTAHAHEGQGTSPGLPDTPRRDGTALLRRLGQDSSRTVRRAPRPV